MIDPLWKTIPLPETPHVDNWPHETCRWWFLEGKEVLSSYFVLATVEKPGPWLPPGPSRAIVGLLVGWLVHLKGDVGGRMGHARAPTVYDYNVEQTCLYGLTPWCLTCDWEKEAEGQTREHHAHQPRSRVNPTNHHGIAINLMFYRHDWQLTLADFWVFFENVRFTGPCYEGPLWAKLFILLNLDLGILVFIFAMPVLYLCVHIGHYNTEWVTFRRPDLIETV